MQKKNFTMDFRTDIKHSTLINGEKHRSEKRRKNLGFLSEHRKDCHAFKDMQKVWENNSIR